MHDLITFSVLEKEIVAKGVQPYILCQMLLVCHATYNLQTRGGERVEEDDMGKRTFVNGVNEKEHN
jgi:hypothetical protein